MNPTRTSDLFIAMIAPLLWGTTYIVTTTFLPVDHPLLIGALRALPIGLVLVLVTRELPQGVWWWRSLILGACNIGLFFALLFLAAVRLPGGITATVGAIQPLIVVFLVWLVFRERPTVQRLAIAVLGLVGVSFLVISSQGHLDMGGLLAAAGAAGAMALGTVLTKHWGRPVGLLSYTAWQLVAGGAILLPVALWVEGVPPSMTAIQGLGLAYLGTVNTGLAYLLWFRGIERLPTTTMPLLGLLSPIVAIGIGYLALEQQLTWTQVGGVVLVLSSVLLSQGGGLRLPSRPTLLPTLKQQPENC